MMRLKLQLFAQKLNTSTSIVDLLKSQGKDSSYSARKKLATSLGIKNYTGSEEQNISMAKALSGSSSGSSNSGSGKTGSGKTGSGKTGSSGKTGGNTGASGTGTGSTILGVDQATTDKINSKYEASDKVKDAQGEADASRKNVIDMSKKENIIDKATMDAINTPYVQSSAVTEAMNYTNGLLQKLNSGRTSYTDRIESLMDEIMNRDKFEYDVDSDTLFQQALSSAMSSGKTAMQDTIGQASALTGGYASTYATSAGNQAYNAYIEDAYNNLPEYYQMALEAYQMEGQDMYNQLAMLNDADATEYERMYNSWSANNTTANQMYDREYGQWRDSVNNAYSSANLQLNEYGQKFDQAYTAYTVTQDNANTMYEQEYKKWADEVDNAFAYAGLLNSDYWNTTNFNENVRQFDANYNENVRQFDETMAQRKSEFNTEMGYKYSALAQDQSQFNARYDVNGDGVVDSKDQTSKGSGSGGDLKEPTETQMSKGLEAYNSGGMTALNQYINSLPSTVDKDLVAEYVGAYGNYDTVDNQLPIEKRTFTKTKDTTNWFLGVDNNDVVMDQYGNTFRIDELPESLQEDLTKLAKGKSYTAK